MKIKIEIAMDNAAFEDAPLIELARVLRELVKDPMLEVAIKSRLYFDGLIRDANGNKVGMAYLSHGDGQ